MPADSRWLKGARLASHVPLRQPEEPSADGVSLLLVMQARKTPPEEIRQRAAVTDCEPAP
ncbi:hypothetical protein [Streptomyces bluensis]|uniref:hypothetical protein n=1 Tax=Streptomyces bluensis TaxID=33897 RepID=UPI0016759417|nr:hypothetical protein [Streptomyces bluensis]